MRILLVIALTLPIAAFSKEQPKKVEIRPVRVTSVQHALSGDTISLTGQIQAKDPKRWVDGKLEPKCGRVEQV